MRNMLPAVCCVLGSGMIGFFSKQLDTSTGMLLFSAGIFLLVASIAVICKR